MIDDNQQPGDQLSNDAATTESGATSANDPDMDRQVDEFDVAMASEHLNKMSSTRKMVFVGQLVLLLVVIVLSLVFLGGSLAPWYTPLAVPIYAAAIFMMLISFEDFWFDNSRVEDTDPRLRRRLVERYVKRMYLPVGVLAVIVLVVSLPFIPEALNDTITQEDQLTVTANGPGKFSFSGRDPIDLTQFNYVLIEARFRKTDTEATVDCHLLYDDTANEIIDKYSSNTPARELEFDKQQFSEVGELKGKSFYDIRLDPGFWEFREYAITIYNKNTQDSVNVYFTFGKEIDHIFLNVLRVIGVIALAGHIIWLVLLIRKKTELEDQYDDYIAHLELKKKEAKERENQERLRSQPQPGIVMINGVPVLTASPQPPGMTMIGPDGRPAQVTQAQQYSSPAMPAPIPVAPSAPVTTTIACPKCKNKFQVPTQPRPLDIVCPSCGKSGTLGARSNSGTKSGSSTSVSTLSQQSQVAAQTPVPAPASGVSSAPAGGSGTSKIRCPGCKNVFEVSRARPIDIECPTCHKKGRLG